MKSVVKMSSLRDQLKSTDAEILYAEETYVSNKRLKFIKLTLKVSNNKLKELKTYREIVSNSVHDKC